MANSGVLGKRAKDGQGRLSLSNKFVQTVYPIPSITGFTVDGVDDTALDPAGGQTVVITGTNFSIGATVVVGGNTIGSVTVVNTTTITFTSEARSSGTYTVFVVNPDGGTAILAPGLIYSGLPTFTTAAGSLGTYYETTAISETVEAIEGADVITYAITAGSLPAGATLASNGVITGTAPVESASTTYTFTVEATDEELQSSTRQFSLTINTDVVTWVSPDEGSISLDGNIAMSAITLSATSAVGYGVSYAADALPTGVALANGVVSGTPTVEETVTTTFTATAATTGRSATRTVTFVISLGDAFFKNTVLLLNGDVNTFITDASDNNFAITPNGDVRPSAFSPYNTSWSNYFDGSGDYLTSESNAGYNLGTTFSVEGWIYSQAATKQVLANLSGFVFIIESTGFLNFYNGSSLFGGSGATVSRNVWVHVAFTRDASNVVRGFVNGVLTWAFTVSTGTSQTTAIIGSEGGNQSFVNGFLSNVRIIKGAIPSSYQTSSTTPGTTIFTPPTAPLTAISGTSLLTCQSNRLIDNSTNNFTITKNGDVKVTSFGPFIDTDTTTGSAYFDGSDYLSVAAETSIDLASSNFTIECWVYPGTQTNSVDSVFGYGGFTTMLYRNGTTWSWEVGNGSSANYFTITATLIPNAWQHIALTRYGNTFTFWINGALAGTNSTANAVGTASKSLAIGYNNNSPAAQHFTGYISNFRLVKGTAVYTAAFTPPTSPLTAIANTSLLTLQNRISYNNSQPIDESGVKNIITRNGNASVGTFSPHVPTGWSAKFNGYGTSESITCTTNSGIDFGSGDFTIEAWINYAKRESRAILTIGAGSGSDWLTVGNGALYWTISGAWNQQLSPNNSVPINEWVHVVFQRISSVLSTHINGVYQSGNTSNRTDAMGASGVTLYIGTNGDLIIPDGFITEVRIIKGEGVYGTSNFTPSTSPLGITSNTSFLWHGGELRDSISHGLLTKSSTVKIQPYSPFRPHTIAPNSYSVYFDGSGDYISANHSSSNSIAGDFTFECWTNYTSDTPAIGTILGWRSGSSGWSGFILQRNNSSNLVLNVNSGGITITQTSATYTPNVWHHVAVTRSGSTVTLWVDGVSVGTSTLSGTISPGTGFTLGVDPFNIISGTYFKGYISNARFVNGTAVYTTAFTPPTALLTTITNTTVLTCQSQTFVDNSANNFAITVNGNSQPTKFNPFGETVTTGVEYAPASHGGSMYFDGTGDELNAGSSSEFAFGAGAYTVEFWTYLNVPVSSTHQPCFVFNNTTGGFGVWNQDGNGIAVSGRSTSPNILNTNVNLVPRQWNHVAVVRRSTSSNQLFVFINGSLVATGTDATNWTVTGPMQIGGITTNDYYLNGYVSNLRIVKGTAVYISAFVPPAAPADPIAGSTLLINGTNAAIQDRTGRNVLETVGNAQIRTSVKKFGTGSLAFDGTRDMVQMPPGPNFVFGTGDFTIEGWAYATSLEGGFGSIIYCQAGSGVNYLVVVVSPGGIVQCVINNTAGVDSPSTISLNTWFHFAVVRSSGSLRVYLNGVGGTAASRTTDLTNTTYIPALGKYQHAEANTWRGYIDDFRITKGVARYTSNFTPPTAAFETR